MSFDLLIIPLQGIYPKDIIRDEDKKFMYQDVYFNII